MRNIRNIVFDLGGVIIDLHREKAVDALISLGISEADNILGLYRQEEPILSLETGHSTAAEFFDSMRRIAGRDIPDCDMENAFNSFLTDIPTERLKALRQLRQTGYRLFVLSNTNPVMFNGWITSRFRQEGLTVNDYFDGIVVSFQELRCKPDTEIFSTVLRRYSLDGEETLMLDDSEANCVSARAAGMKALKIDNSSESESMLAIAGRLLEQRS